VTPPLEITDGVILWPGRLDPAAQAALIGDVLARAKTAPFYRPQMPQSGKLFSVEETNFGPLGWVSDRSGYRYQPTHPYTLEAWPEIPHVLLELWNATTGYPAPPECCLVNLYRDGAKMGLHQDRDEVAVAAPVLSVSLGDDALFRIGGTTRRGPTRSLKLASGDVLMFGGPARLAYHGVDRVVAGSSMRIPGGGRLNLTLRRVNPAGLWIRLADKKTPGQGADRASHAPLRAGAGRG
jgi:DNA oxidative demethylase